MEALLGFAAASQAGQAIDARLFARLLHALLKRRDLRLQPAHRFLVLLPHQVYGLAQRGDVFPQAAPEFGDVLHARKGVEAVGELGQAGFVALAVAFEAVDGPGDRLHHLFQGRVALIETDFIRPANLVHLLDGNRAGIIDLRHVRLALERLGGALQLLMRLRRQFRIRRQGCFRKGGDQAEERFGECFGSGLGVLNIANLFAERDHGGFVPFITTIVAKPLRRSILLNDNFRSIPLTGCLSGK